MCQGLDLRPTPPVMSDSLAAVWVCRQPAERVLGLAAGRHGKVLVTVQGDGVITYAAAQEASGNTRALGSSHAQFLAPVQQLGTSYVAAVQPQGSAYGVLLSTPISAQNPKPLLDAEQQLPLPSKPHSLHVLHPADGSGKPAGPGVAAVVLADGTVGAADFAELCLHTSTGTAANGNGVAAAAISKQRMLSAACDGGLLAVAQQPHGSHAVAVDVYTATTTQDARTSAAAAASADNSAPQQHKTPARLQLCHSCSIPQPSPSSKLSGVSVAEDLLVVLWSCHSVSVYHHGSSHHHQHQQQGQGQQGHVAQLQLPTPFAAVLAAAATAGGEAGEKRSTAKRKQTTAAAAAAPVRWTAAALSGQHVLVVALQDDAGQHKVHYAVLDSTYGSCLMSGSFTTGTAASTAAAAGSSAVQLQLLPLPSHPFAPVALLAAGSVWLLPLQLPKADLAGLVASMALGGKQAAAAAATAAAGGGQVNQSLLTARQHLNLASIAAAANASAAGQRQQGLCVLQPLQQHAAGSAAAADAADDAPLPAALQQLRQVLNMQKRPAQELQAAATQLCDALEEQQQASASVLVSQQLLATALSALADAQQWDLLQRLHQLQPLQSLAACADLVPVLATAHQYGSMRRVLLAAQEIPAEAVVGAMRHLLVSSQQQQQQQQAGDAASASQSAAAQQMRAAAEAVVQQAESAAAAGQLQAADQLVKAARAAAVAVDGFTARELLLHVLLSVQVDGVEAQACLKTLPAAAVLRLLRYLVKWLHKNSRDSITATSSDPLLITPTGPQVLEWCRLLLDAQLTKLMLMPAAGPLLQQLQQLLRSEVSCTSKLLALKGVTDTWASGAPLPAAAMAANSQYVLELLDLRVKPVSAAAAAGAAAAARHK